MGGSRRLLGIPKWGVGGAGELKFQWHEGGGGGGKVQTSIRELQFCNSGPS